jgi:terminase small subunit / prophage DNA-packing protein
MTKISSKRQGATAAQLASLWSCDERTVQRMAQKGVAVKVGRGTYDLATSTKNYIVHLREQAAGRGGKDVVAANIAFRESQTRLNDQRFKREARELIPVEEVSTTWRAIMRTVRQFVLTLPNQIAFEVPTLTVHDRQVIARISREGLEDAAMARGFAITPADREIENDHS